MLRCHLCPAAEDGGEEAGQGVDQHHEAADAASPAEQRAQQAAAAAAAEQAAFGEDVFADRPADEGQEAAAAAALLAAPVAGGSLAAGGGEADAEDLYGDLGAVVPQVDGAADSPPLRGRHRGADPGERWELGRDGELGEAGGGAGGDKMGGVQWGACCSAAAALLEVLPGVG